MHERHYHFYPYKESKDIGITRYRFVAALSERTCVTCGDLDGKVFEVEDAVEGKNYPPIHPNCRCATVMADAISSTRAAKDPLTGKSYKVNGNMTFNKWKDSLTDEQRKAMELHVRQMRNSSADKKQYEKYKAIIGTDSMPKTLEKFTELKYNNGDKRDELKSQYRHTKYGFTSGALNADSKEALQHAVQYYESVRKMKTDINNISKNTGWNEDSIEKIKNHIFYENHKLSGGYGRFDPDYNMAISWQRLIDGKTIKEMDIVLLKHEYLELTLVKKGYSQDEAHIISSKKHNYTTAVEKGK